MGKKVESTTSNTHKWICYVRGVNNEDLSYLISKVEFVLHSTFEDNVKSRDVIMQPLISFHSRLRRKAGANFNS